MRIPRILLAIGTISFTSGCFVNHRGYVEPDPLSLCLIGGCIGWHLAEETRVDRRVETPPPPSPQPSYQHDHFHGDGCGCPSRWIQGHRAYWYHGHWEYYDGANWYVFEGTAPEPTW